MVPLDEWWVEDPFNTVMGTIARATGNVGVALFVGVSMGTEVAVADGCTCIVG